MQKLLRLELLVVRLLQGRIRGGFRITAVGSEGWPEAGAPADGYSRSRPGRDELVAGRGLPLRHGMGPRSGVRWRGTAAGVDLGGGGGARGTSRRNPSSAVRTRKRGEIGLF